MRGDRDPAWHRYYVVIERAMIAWREGRITGTCWRIIHEQARKRAYRDQA